MTSFGVYPTPIRRKITITPTVKQAIDAACRAIYKEEPFKTRVIAYEYGSLLMYSVSAYSNSKIPPVGSLDDVKSAFVSSMPMYEAPPTDIVLGRIVYPAPSSAKFLLVVHT